MPGDVATIAGLKRDLLIEKLRGDNLTPLEAQELTKILKYEESEAKRKGRQVAAIAIGGLISLTSLMSKK